MLVASATTLRDRAEQDKEAADFKAKLEKVKKEKDDVKKREASRKEELQVGAGEAAAVLVLLAQKYKF